MCVFDHISKIRILDYYGFYRFSSIGLLHTKLRTRLSDRTVEDLFILRHHFLAQEKKETKIKRKRKVVEIEID